MKTIKELAQGALDVQNACNLTGVALGMHRALSDLMYHVDGTDTVNHHPIARLWADKVAQLAGNEQGEMVAVYSEVYRLAAEGGGGKDAKICEDGSWRHGFQRSPR